MHFSRAFKWSEKMGLKHCPTHTSIAFHVLRGLWIFSKPFRALMASQVEKALGGWRGVSTAWPFELLARPQEASCLCQPAVCFPISVPRWGAGTCSVLPRAGWSAEMNRTAKESMWDVFEAGCSINTQPCWPACLGTTCGPKYCSSGLGGNISPDAWWT